MMSKQYAVSIAMPVNEKNGGIQGIVAGDLLLSTITETVGKINLDGLGYAFLLDKKGMILAHPDEQQVNTSAAENIELKPLLAGMQANVTGQQYLATLKVKTICFTTTKYQAPAGL